MFQEISAKDELRDLTLYLQGKIAIANGEYDLARRNFEEAAKCARDDAYVLRELERLLFEHFSPADAIPLLRNSLALDSGNASAWHNLGVALMARQDWQEAEGALRESLKLRPNHQPTKELLAQCRKTAS